MSSEDKKQEQSIKKRKFEQKVISKNKLFLIPSIGIVLLLAIGVYFFLKSGPKNPGSMNRTTNLGVQTYDRNVEMTDIPAEIGNGKISINLAEVKKNKFVIFKYGKKQIATRGFETQDLPMLAYIAPGGDLVTAVSMCEPCKSIKFHIEPDNTLTCNACGTKFDAQTLEGISGACVDYPPDEVKYKVKNDNILINESEVATWKPRD